MATFTSHVERYTQIRLSFCLRMFITMTLALVVVTIGLAQEAPSGASGDTTILTCDDLEKPIQVSGEYRLIEDCKVGRFKTAIDIRASYVHLNMRGHTISGDIRTPSQCADVPPPGTQDEVGIHVRGSNVHINNGTVIRFNTGILLQDHGDNNHANNLTVTGNCLGIRAHLSDNNLINGNNVSGNFGIGVQLQEANNNWVHSNVVNNNGNSGVFLDPANGNLIDSNEILLNGETGIRLSNSNNNFILDNKVNGNSRVSGGLAAGILIFVDANNPESRGNFIQGNTAVFNEGADLYDRNLDDEPFGGGPLNCINFWRRNTFTDDNEVLGRAGPRAGCIR